MPLGRNHSGAPQKLLNACGLPHGTTTFIWNHSTLFISSFLSMVCILHLFAYILPCMLAGNLAWHIQCSSRRQLVREVSFVWMNHLISSSHAAHLAIFTAWCNWPLCFPSVACLHSLSYSLRCPTHPRHQRHKGVLCFCQQVTTEARSNRIHKSINIRLPFHYLSLSPLRELEVWVPFISSEEGLSTPDENFSISHSCPRQWIRLSELLASLNSSTIHHSIFCLSFFLQTKRCGPLQRPMCLGGFIFL